MNLLSNAIKNTIETCEQYIGLLKIFKSKCNDQDIEFIVENCETLRSNEKLITMHRSILEETVHLARKTKNRPNAGASISTPVDCSSSANAVDAADPQAAGLDEEEVEEKYQPNSNRTPSYQIQEFVNLVEQHVSFNETVTVVRFSNEMNETPADYTESDPTLAEWKQYEENKRLCKQHNFKPPLSFKELRKVQFNIVDTFDKSQLMPGSVFLTKEELCEKKRKIDKPFCHPGPEQKNNGYHWYLSDSIVQKIHLIDQPFPFYVVRWVGYNDNHNTVEPLAYVKHTAIFKLFENPETSFGFRSNNSCIRRGCVQRVHRGSAQRDTAALPMASSIAPTKYNLAINKLIGELKIEEKAGRYSPIVGFLSLEGSAKALTIQHDFIKKRFLPLLKELEVPLVVDPHYIGSICGNVKSARKFKDMLRWSVDDQKSIKKYIYNGLREANKVDAGSHYVCFFVPKKHGVDETSDKEQLNFHVCVYAVRQKDDIKQAIYYNPSPPCFKCNLPVCLDNMTNPVMTSVTNMFGTASEKDDCLFQCFLYIIGLATGEVEFKVDLSKPARKYGEFGWKVAGK